MRDADVMLMSSAGVVALVALGCLLVAVAIVIRARTPWRLRLGVDALAREVTWPPSERSADATLDFTEAERSSLNRYHEAAVPPARASLLIGVGATLLLALTPWGAAVMAIAARMTGGSWWVSTLIGTVLLVALTRVATVPFDMRVAAVRRSAGLLTQGWVGWFSDRVRMVAVGGLLTCAALLGLVGAMRLWPLWWWAPVACAASALVVLMGFVAPVVFEPLFHRFTPVPAGPLRERLMNLAEQAKVPVRDVLVADSSRRTTARNAYVSGFGPTRRIVLFDTLVDSTDCDAVIAHELGHARDRDVLNSLLIAALAAAAAVVAVGLLLMVTLTPSDVATAPLGNPRTVPIVLAAVTLIGLISGPIQATVSRRIEARADLAALDLTRDAEGFIDMMRSLALSNRAALTPSRWRYRLLFTHPTAPERIAMARAWTRVHGLPEPEPRAS